MLLNPLNPELAKARIGVLALGALTLAGSFLLFETSPSTLLYIVLFSVSIFITDFIVVEIPREGSLSASVAIILTAVFLGPKQMATPIILLAIVIGTLAGQMAQKKPMIRITMLMTKRIIAATLATIALSLWFILIGQETVFFSRLIAAFIAGFIYFFSEAAIEAMLLSQDKNSAFRTTLISRMRLLAVVFLTFSIIALLMAIMFKWMSFWSIFIFSIPLAVTTQSFKLYVDIRKTYESTIKALSATLEAQDESRVGHAQRVSDYSLSIGKELGLYGKELERLNYAAMLHDIGKLGFDKSVKLDEITKEKSAYDRKNVPFHAQIGAEIISDVDYLKDVSSIIKYHHWSFGAKHNSIPLESSIIHVANDFDHFINEAELSKQDALKKLTEDKGLYYSPKIVRAFKSIFRRRH
ncbi:hypothetical protein LCGC14_1071260 [marine sediment metagenome]|uniref:HD-GYP domain-containing protein n=1 Tax=marine sediment metagenome TaxID=412755 RepID=A0A0F9Q188_9ZZZZ